MTLEQKQSPASRIARDFDVRGLLAIITVVGFFGVVFTQLFKGDSIAIPAEVAAVVTGVCGFYFGSRGGSSNGNGH